MTNDSVDELIAKLQRVRLEENSLLNQLVSARARETNNTETFVVGTRVYIVNRISKFAGRTANENDRRSIVTSVNRSGIYVRTVNGILTWRIRSNLRIVSEDELW
jgi:16S rRNA G1207 methylase RsmC